MRIGIVLKLFMLTTLLCMLILVIMYIGQTIFFKQYYASQKVEEINTSMESFEKEYLKAEGDVQAIKQLEQGFQQEHTTWITTLDSVGNIKYANDFSVEIDLDSSEYENFSNRTIHVPLYSFIDLEELDRLKFNLEQVEDIFIDGIIIDNTVVPAILTGKSRNVVLENRLLSEELYGQRTEIELVPEESSTRNIKKITITSRRVIGPKTGNRTFSSRKLTDIFKRTNYGFTITSWLHYLYQSSVYRKNKTISS